MSRWPSDRSIERKILFFGVDAGQDDGGVPLPFDAVSMLRQIQVLSLLEGERYWTDETGNLIFCRVDELSTPQRLRLIKVRRSDLPQIELEGQLSPLDIPENCGLAETTHLIFFPDGIVGCEFNFHGPRISRLEHYVAEKHINQSVKFVAKARQDSIKQLERLEDIRVLKLKMHTSYASRQLVAKSAPIIEGVLEATEKLGSPKVVEVILRPELGMWAAVKSELLSLMRHLSHQTNSRSDLLQGEVKGLNGDTDQVDVIDLFSERIVVKKSVDRTSTRSRGVDSRSMYAAIEDAYSEVRDQLMGAVGVTVALGAGA